LNSAFPLEVIENHTAIVGKTGAGKTSTGKLLIEQVADIGARVCILDPIKSDHWGLTSSADGKHEGLPFYVLGGPHRESGRTGMCRFMTLQARPSANWWPPARCRSRSST
jgi:hypothetical protein